MHIYPSSCSQNGHDSCIEAILRQFGDKYCNAKDLKGRYEYLTIQG